MAKPNYRHQKKQREQAQKRKKEAKLQRRFEKNREPDPIAVDPKVDIPTDSA